jgi:branched-subunit amino acid aminotransferase/4-amino-4-deoxychorismate lyase
MTTPKAVHFLDGKWVEGNPPIMGPMTHGAWMASVVFDGARAFEGVTPDLDLHCERLVRSAESFGLKAVHPAGELLEIAKDGLKHFDKDAALYLRPMLWAESGFVSPDPESTRFVHADLRGKCHAPVRSSDPGRVSRPDAVQALARPCGGPGHGTRRHCGQARFPRGRSRNPPPRRLRGRRTRG